MIKVLIIDDSALIRKMLSEILNSDPNIEVIGSAADPYIARDKIKKLKPDLITLDVEMPKMDGITFLRNLMRLHPLPVLMVSSLTEKGAEVTLDALEAGAVDFVTKPKIDVAQTFDNYKNEIISKVKVVARANVTQLITKERPKRKKSVLIDPNIDPNTGQSADGKVAKKHSVDVIIKRAGNRKHFRTTDRVIAIGASTGGTEAIRVILEELPAGTPGVVITQHIPAAFSGPFAERMNSISDMNVSEAKDGQQILPGHVYISPGDKHLLVERDGARYICRLNDGELVNRHKPSVDVLFRSVAENVGPNAIGIILTGMGADGALGLAEMRNSDGDTIAQDEGSSIVWGMPGEAVKLGGAEQVLSLGTIADALQQILK
ncbi:MAG: chemotaxis response regulator protein-glutamate methylesterase [Thiotrichales bacterium]|jgi:two-component system chemotaxis response regulator CheB|nr:chemotaxis response regulator protein-glutamate methylesterase [Thiotrichales bacterium]MBT3614064.1 chemotaxis response regulator protein-glutamate methylesterase [Thiotrichales bacterium]MBT4260877.1 chemotaxis response regulator protein-glutamate methylesterase [Thiotrichales bacterium]MBT5290535.1 chemotaxis response regulator protein-glutamate methylesterase [Thiotrichales bacterium]MBT5417820.1 chemotaxis response regulator protein-glutamate methylesterase [Thiotrichales bacterium]